jgi:hypothetical protein
LVERFFNKIKHCRRVATRYDKLAANYLAFLMPTVAPGERRRRELQTNVLAVVDPCREIEELPEGLEAKDWYRSGRASGKLNLNRSVTHDE